MQVKTLTLGAVVATAFAVPALAEPECSPANAKPMWEAVKTFEDAGGVVENAKVNQGCYEIYGTQDGEDVEVFYDPDTGAELERE